MTDAAKAQAEDDCSDERSIPANSMSPFVAPLRRAVAPQLCLIAGLDGSEVHAIKANDPKRTSAGTSSNSCSTLSMPIVRSMSARSSGVSWVKSGKGGYSPVCSEY